MERRADSDPPRGEHDRRRTLVLATAARRELDRREPRTRGRVWVNGRELGRVDERFAHLARSHD